MRSRCAALWFLLGWCLAAGPLRGQAAGDAAAALLAAAEASTPETVLILVDGKENEMFTRRVTYDAGRDIYDIHLAHLGGTDFLWEVRFGDSPIVDDGAFSLWLDTDRDAATGLRAEDGAPRAGADVEVVISQGQSVVRAWSADGAVQSESPLGWFRRERSLFFVLSLPVVPVRQTVSFAMAAESRSATTAERPKPAMQDATRKAVVHRFRLRPPEDPGLDHDDDGDGLTNRVERDFGTDPAVAAVFTPVITAGPQPAARRALETYVAGMDIIGVEAAHIAEDRYLFRLNFAAEPALSTMTCILYLDVDNDRATGRDMGPNAPITGTDVMLSCSGGKAGLSLHGIAAADCGDGQVRHTVVGNSLVLCADLPIKTTAQGAEFGAWVLTHTAGTPQPPMSDNTPRVQDTKLPLQAGKKIDRGTTGWKAEGGLSRAYGLDVIRPILWAPETVRVEYDTLEMSGFDIDYYTTLEHGHIKPLRAEATAASAAPKGRYHVAFMIFDRRNYGGRVGIRIDDRERGAAAIDAGNNNYWLYWLDEAIDFAGGELVELVALSGMATLPIHYLLFIKDAPAPREQSCAVDSLAYRVAADGSGAVHLSWISENPVPTRLEYGLGEAFDRVYETPEATLLHRAVLRELEPGGAYQARGVGRDLAGAPVTSAPVRFRAERPAAPPTQAGVARVPLRVVNPHGAPLRNWLVRSGVPFPQGVLGSAKNLRLRRDGQDIPADVRETAHWPDYSVKWVLVTFTADCPAGGEAAYDLEYGAAVTAPAASVAPLAREAGPGEGLAIDTGAARFRITAQGELVLDDGRPVRTRIQPSSGEALATGDLPARLTINANSAVHTRVTSEVVFPGPEDVPVVTVTTRFDFWAGSPLVALSHSFLVQGQESHSLFEEISLELPLGGATWQAAVRDGTPLELKAADRLFQREFGHYLINGGEPVEGRCTGQFQSGRDMVVLRQFWELYPKGFQVDADGARLELCPDFETGYYDSFPFDVKSTKTVYYLREGHYRLRRGLRKTHDVLLGRTADDASAASAASAALAFQRPLLATAPADWYCASGAFYAVAPRNEEMFAGYERNVDRNVGSYRSQRETMGDYGMLNFGDWFGERGVHWGNGEYDDTAALLLEYVRSGNLEAYHLASEAEKHNRDVDSEHWVPGKGPVGKVYIHQMGHHGGHYGGKSPKGAEAWDSGGGSATHSWSEGHLWYYFLSGEEDALAAGLGTVDYHIATGHAFYYHLAGELRNPAWRLIMDAAAYAATYDPAYLNAATLIMRTVLLYQDTIPRPLPEHQVTAEQTHQVGGWSRMLVPGHCHCEPRHRGNANFMVALLLSGMKYYHEMTGDPATKEALIKGAYYLLDECYSEKTAGFRYTSCPAMRYSRGTIPYMVEGIARAYRWTGDPRLAHPLTVALPYGERGGQYGKGFGSYYRGGPRVLADMLALKLAWKMPETGATPSSGGPFAKPAWLTDGAVVAQAEDFKAQGVGECQVFGDREGAWGRIVSYWHSDIGHWLEWQVDIPADGLYALRFHYATQSPETTRELRINGEVPCPEARAIVFPSTDGFGMNPLDWAYTALRDAKNKDVPLRLSKGRHTVRLTNVKDGLAFDFMAFVPVAATGAAPAAP